MNVLCYEFRWVSETEMQFQGSRENQFGRKTIQVGDEISLSINGPTRCAGWMRDGKWNSCENHVTGKKRCETCRAKEGNFVFTSFDGFNTASLTPDDLARISGEHWVYLALFDRNLIKVGVSKADRKNMRQIEQGSHFTLYIAHTADGTQARQIETLVRNHGFADKIPASQKKEFMTPEITVNEGEEILRNKYKQVETALKDYAELQSFCLPTPEFVDWSETYGLQNILDSDKKFHVVKLSEDEAISGKIIAVKGPFLVVETPEELVSVCAKDFMGKPVSFMPTPPGLKTKAALQNSLF